MRKNKGPRDAGHAAFLWHLVQALLIRQVVLKCSWCTGVLQALLHKSIPAAPGSAILACFQSNLGITAHASLWATVVAPLNPESWAGPAGTTHLQHSILLPSVGPCAAAAAMHQLHPANADLPSSMALSEVTMAVASMAAESSSAGIIMTLGVGLSGAVTADCSGAQILSCQATSILVSEPLPTSGSPVAMAVPGRPPSALPYGRFAHTDSSSLAAVIPNLRGRAGGDDAFGLGQMVGGDDPDKYAMSPEDMEAAAQLASGGPEVLLACAAGLRAHPSGRTVHQDGSWLAGCAYPLGQVQVSKASSLCLQASS